MNEYSIACGGSRSLNNRTTQQRHRRGLVMVALILGLICGCRSGPPSEPNPAERPVPATPSSAKEHPFASTIARAKLDEEEPPPLKRPEVLEAKKVQKKRVSLKVGTDAVTVELEITSKVEPEILEYLLGHLRLERFDPKRHQAMTPFFEGRGKLLQGQPEVRFPELLGPNQDQLVPVWPMGWEVVRPHVLRWVPWFKKGGPGGEEGGDGGDMDPGDGDVGSTTAALTGSWTTVTGSILCQAPGEPAFPLANVGVSINGATATAGPAGSFTVTGAFTEVTQLVVTFQGRPAGLTAPATAQMVIVNDFHEARGEHVPITTGTTSGRVLNVGALRLSSLDCELYEKGTIALRRYLDIVGAAPPASDGYRIKRWSDIWDGTPHTYYDYVAIANNFRAIRPNRGNRLDTIFHEFGHTVRHVADGDHVHWDGDNVAYLYARVHNPAQIMDEGYIFNEAWANYWECTQVSVTGPCPGFDARAPQPVPGAANVAASLPFMDWNEWQGGRWLSELATPVGHAAMVGVLLANPGTIHTLRQFELAYCRAFGAANPHCDAAGPIRPKAACPPGFRNDGAFCRQPNIRAKPSQPRGVGTLPTGCGGGDYDAGLCYQNCPAGFEGVGPVCWARCPAGMQDDGAFCRRDVNIRSSDNSSCPWWDVCGLTFARGCSTCPAGFQNDGCTCRVDAWIFAKETQTRGAGRVPTACSGGRQYDAGLCYPPCPAGMAGVGPVCWGRCDPGFDDHGATCYREPNIFIRR